MENSHRPDPYIRPYGENAPWNVPVDGLQIHPDSENLADLLWNDATAARPGNFNLSFDGFTYPVYYAGDATGTFTVDTTWSTNIDGEQIPWNPDWQPATGSDGQVIVLDPATGQEWNLWQVSFDGTTVSATNGSLVDGSYWTKEDGWFPSRGAGIQYYAMLVQPEEIALGEINHALSMPIINTDGDEFVAPATKLEHPSNPPGIPEGTRFFLDITDADINAWIGGMPSGLPQTTKDSARVIAEALRDYGWFITDTSGGAHLQFEDRATAGAQWNALGLGESSDGGAQYPRDLLDGLIQADNIRAVVPSDQYGSSPPPPDDTPTPSDTIAPTAGLVGASGIFEQSSAAQAIVIEYSDNVAVDVSTLDGNDIAVFVPGGAILVAALSSIDVSSDGTPRQATYTLAAPGGTWETSDNGTYTIQLRANEVDDTSGNSAAGGDLGSFDVTISDNTPSLPSANGGRIEAENMALNNYVVESGSFASSNQLIAVSSNGGTATASFEFSGNADTYTVKVGYFDENDGQATVGIALNGQAIETWTLAQDLPNSLAGANNFVERTIEEVSLQPGDFIELRGEYVQGERSRFDYIEINSPNPPPDDTPAPSDTTAPTAGLVGVSDIFEENSADQALVVEYSDNVAVDVSTLDGDDIAVSGPGGAMLAAALSSIDVNSDGTPRRATYTLTAPGGTWESSDNGTYKIQLQASEIDDTSGNSAAADTLGSFAVSIAGETPPPDDTPPDTSGPVDLFAAPGQFDVVDDPVAAGQSLTVQFAVENDEAGSAGAFDVDFYISTNSWISANDEFLGSRTISGLAGNSTTGTLTETLNLPGPSDSFWRGDDAYYIGMIIDDADVVEETSEGNNLRTGQGNDRDGVFVNVTTPPPDDTPEPSGPADLSGSAGQFRVVQDPTSAGNSVDVEFGIQNTETGSTGSFVVDFYLSRNSWISGNDEFLGSRTIEGLAGNSSTGTLTETLTLPDSADRFWRGDDTYHIGMIIDDADIVDETNERNNRNQGVSEDYDDVFVSLLL